MNIQLIAIAVISLLIGGAGGYLIKNQSLHTISDGSLMHGDTHSVMEGEMDAMMEALEGKVGDEFDKVFLSEMIMHHQGAVMMAEAALQNANHGEIKDMSRAIISAQNSEIKQMQDWQKAWYGQ